MYKVVKVVHVVSEDSKVSHQLLQTEQTTMVLQENLLHTVGHVYNDCYKSSALFWLLYRQTGDCLTVHFCTGLLQLGPKV